MTTAVTAATTASTLAEPPAAPYYSPGSDRVTPDMFRFGDYFTQEPWVTPATTPNRTPPAPRVPLATPSTLNLSVTPPPQRDRAMEAALSPGCDCWPMRPFAWLLQQLCG